MNNNSNVETTDQTDIEQLLTIVGQLNRTLRASIKKEGYDLDGNLLHKFARHYFRHQNEDNTLEHLFKLMEQAPEKRGNKYVANWRIIRETIKKQEQRFKRLSTEDLAYVLGWLAKMARA